MRRYEEDLCEGRGGAGRIEWVRNVCVKEEEDKTIEMKKEERGTLYE